MSYAYQKHRLLVFIKFALVTILVISCSKSDNGNQNTKDINLSGNGIPQSTTIKAEFMRSSNHTSAGDFTKVHFEVEDYVGHTLLNGNIDCNEEGNQIVCKSTVDLNALRAGIYRLLLKSNDGLLGSDLFEIMPGIVPVVVTIDNETTGFYLISLVTKATGFREDEIYKRVRNILGGDPEEDYDLEPTLYDLFIHYNGHKNASGALNKVIQVINLNQPIQGLHTGRISQTLTPLY